VRSFDIVRYSARYEDKPWSWVIGKGDREKREGENICKLRAHIEL
jgi:hypothetical protein